MDSSKLLLTKGLKIVHVNIRSLYRKLDQLTSLYCKTDFLLCSETWLNSKYDMNGITICGMIPYRLDRCEASPEERRLGNIPVRGGGVIIYVNQKWSPYVCVVDDFTVITRNYECITLRVQKPNNRIMYIMCVYKPPTGSSDALLVFLRNFVNIPHVLRSEIWILGDFNICVREYETPWFTNEIYECIKKRAEYVHHFRKSCNSDIFEIEVKLKYFRNKCNKLIREAKSNFIKTNLEINRNNPKKFWRILNSVLTTKNDTDNNFEFINQDTKTRISPSESPNFLNSFFANVGKRKEPATNYFGDRIINGERFEIGNVNLDEVKLLLRQIDVSKDSCIVGITSVILKSAFNIIPNAMLHMFERSLVLGVFPREWAVGYINLLPKGGDKRNPSNWRPITQTCIPGKILEKLVQKRLMSYLNDKNILSKDQYGFRSGYSTQKAIFELLCSLHLSLNHDDIMGLLFLDISKAFHSLDHDVLIRKLSHISLADNSLNWFKSYLNRTQYVRFNGTRSDSAVFKYGIPQGSCLRPTLFIFYINDIFNEIDNVNVMMFADNCVLYSSGKAWDDIHYKLQAGLDTYIMWGREHNLSLNAKKTKAMLVISPNVICLSTPPLLMWAIVGLPLLIIFAI